MKKLFITLGISSLILMGITFALPRGPVQYIDQSIGGHHVKAVRSYVGVEYKIAVGAVDNGYPAKTVKQFMEEEGGIAAINGSFFCPNESAYSRCEQGTTDKMRISDGQVYAKWYGDMSEGDIALGRGHSYGVYTFGNENRGRYHYEDGTQGWNNTDMFTMNSAIQMPALVYKGDVVSHLNNEMNGDAKQSRSTTKQFICGIDNREVMFGSVSNITFHDLGYYLKDNFGCDDAILLDGGGSSALYAEGEYKRGPGRKVMDAFVLVPKTAGQIASYNMNYTLPAPEPVPYVAPVPVQSYPFGDIDTPVTDALLIRDYLGLFNTIDDRLKEERSDTRLSIYRNFIGYARDIDQDNVPKSQIESTWRVITIARWMKEVLNNN